MKRRGSRSSPDRASQEGASAVEFAIVAPLLFMLIFAIIQFGIIFAQDLAVSNAARQAARTAAVPASGDCATIIAEAEQGATTIAMDNTEGTDFEVEVLVTSEPGNLDQCDAADAGTPPCEGAPAGTEVRVTVKSKARLALPLVGAFDSIQLVREGFYRCEFT